MALDAEDSNEWRAAIWKIWREDFCPLNQWLGRGFGFPIQWAQQPVFLSRSAENQGAVAVGNIHNGLFLAVDTFGLIGTLFFVASGTLVSSSECFAFPLIPDRPKALFCGSSAWAWPGLQSFALGSAHRQLGLS